MFNNKTKQNKKNVYSPNVLQQEAVKMNEPNVYARMWLNLKILQKSKSQQDIYNNNIHRVLKHLKVNITTYHLGSMQREDVQKGTGT